MTCRDGSFDWAAAQPAPVAIASREWQNYDDQCLIDFLLVVVTRELGAGSTSLPPWDDGLRAAGGALHVPRRDSSSDAVSPKRRHYPVAPFSMAAVQRDLAGHGCNWVQGPSWRRRGLRPALAGTSRIVARVPQFPPETAPGSVFVALMRKCHWCENGATGCRWSESGYGDRNGNPVNRGSSQNSVVPPASGSEPPSTLTGQSPTVISQNLHSCRLGGRLSGSSVEIRRISAPRFWTNCSLTASAGTRTV